MSLPKTAVIGVRGFASMYLRNFARLQDEGRIEWAAAVVRSPAKAPEETAMLQQRGVAVYPTASALYEAVPDLDLVGIPTGIEFHEAMTCEALSHGVNVLVEKPASTTTASVDRMIAAEQAHPDTFAAVGFQHMADRTLWYIKNVIHSRKLGKLKHIRVHGVWPRADAYYARNNWSGKIASANGTLILDSPANNAFAHYINIALFLAADQFAATAEPKISAARIFRARQSIETFDTCAVDFTANGVDVSVFLTHTGLEASEPRFHAECTAGSVDWQMDADWTIRDAGGKVLASGLTGYSYENMFNDVVDKISDRSVYTCTLSMARSQAALIEAMYRDWSVETFPPAILHRRPEDGQLYVDGLTEFGLRCFRNGVADAGDFPVIS